MLDPLQAEAWFMDLSQPVGLASKPVTHSIHELVL